MVTVGVRCTRGSQLYALDETARFEITVGGRDELSSDATVNVQLSSDTAVVFWEKAFRLAETTMPLVAEGTMPTPGFLRCRATVSAGASADLSSLGVTVFPVAASDLVGAEGAGAEGASTEGVGLEGVAAATAVLIASTGFD